MFTATDIDDVAGEQLEPGAVLWMRREQIAPEAMQSMFASIERRWRATDDHSVDTVIAYCGQAFRLGWESQKGAC